MKRKDAIDIIYEDEALLVINKGSGLLSLPDRFKPELPNIKDWADRHCGRIWIVHRLDRDTSGLLILAKSEAAHRHLSLQFENRQVKKYYLALVKGRPAPSSGTVDRPIAANPHRPGRMIVSKSGKEALTSYEVLESFRAYSLLHVSIHTGRTHQIRVHMKAIGCPLAIDPIYADDKGIFLSQLKGKSYQIGKNKEERALIQRLSLHAKQLSFLHPVSNKEISFEAPLHKDYRAVLKQLRKWST
ncbi:MAG: RluA family pseudouridine synthase [Saprospiraceae bacterium]|nr:RluA family pseudouridine synthase [Saprospiraceae bacterium]